MENDNISFSKKEVQEMMMKAYIKGENRGLTYAGWFFLSEEDKADRAAEDCEEIYRNVSLNKESHSPTKGTK